MTDQDRERVMEAVTEAALLVLEHEPPNYRNKLANLIRRDVARRLAVPTPKESQ